MLFVSNYSLIDSKRCSKQLPSYSSTIILLLAIPKLILPAPFYVGQLLPSSFEPLRTMSLGTPISMVATPVDCLAILCYFRKCKIAPYKIVLENHAPCNFQCFRIFLTPTKSKNHASFFTILQTFIPNHYHTTYTKSSNTNQTCLQRQCPQFSPNIINSFGPYEMQIPQTNFQT
jgi:hypothetical protein